MPSKFVIAVGLLLGVTAPVALATPSAASTPSVTFGFATPRVDVRTAASFTYSVTQLPSGASLALQEQQGTQHVWRSVESLSGTTGTAQVQTKTVGAYQFRVAALSARTPHQILAASGARALYVYGNVPFTTFCNNGHVEPQNLAGECFPGTAQVGGRIFNYVAAGTDGDDYPDYHDWLNFTRSTCRSVTVAFGITDDSGQTGDVAYVKVVTATRDPQLGSAPFGTVGSYTAKLDGRPWDLNLSEAANGGNEELVANGVASCYTLTGH